MQAADAQQQRALPRTFGRYQLFDHIGQGGMADIYLARMANSLGGHRLVVIKQIREELSDASFVTKLTEEAKLAAQLNHANVVQVFDLGKEEERLYIAMDYVEGFDLNQLLRQLSKARLGLPSQFIFTIVIETLRGLDYAHRATSDKGEPLGLVHRDVSPSNVLISFEGEVKVCDFGIARAHVQADPEESKLEVAGKAAYMSPEHARGEVVDARADVFAAGILLWELAAGRRLYKAKGDALLELAKAADIPRLPNRGLPEHDKLQSVLDKALAPDRDSRYASAADFLADLEDYAISAGLRASPLRFGAFLADNFAEQILAERKERERAAEAVEEALADAAFGPASVPPPAPDAKGAIDASLMFNKLTPAATEPIDPAAFESIGEGHRFNHDALKAHKKKEPVVLGEFEDEDSMPSATSAPRRISRPSRSPDSSGSYAPISSPPAMLPPAPERASSPPASSGASPQSPQRASRDTTVVYAALFGCVILVGVLTFFLTRYLMR